MIIIEETEEDKNRAALLDEDSFEDEELTTEEAKYRSAKDLRDSLELSLIHISEPTRRS